MMSDKAPVAKDVSSEVKSTASGIALRKGVVRPYDPTVKVREEAGYIEDVTGQKPEIVLLRIAKGKGVQRQSKKGEQVDENRGFVLDVTRWSPESVQLKISGGNGVVEEVAGMDPTIINKRVARQRGIVELEMLDVDLEPVKKRGIIQVYGEADPVGLGKNLGLV